MNTKRLLPLPLAALVALLCGPAQGFTQSVLLTAGDYAVLGGTAISVGGPGPNPIVNGHVGLSPAATSNITGFPPAVVSGFTLSGDPAAIIATGGATSQAILDLIKAKNALYALPSNVTLSNVDLGTVAPLNAGVYTFGGAASQTGALVLDAQGLNGVAWVFNIATSLTTSVNSTVSFINVGSNGGTDLGLFWNVGTGINIGDNNTLLGNYLAGTSISFTGITTTLGGTGTRALAQAGVSFAGPGTINPLGGPGGGDYDGGYTYGPDGSLIPIAAVVPPAVPPVIPPVIPPAVIPPVPPVVPPVVFTGNVILSSTGQFTPGASGVTLVPGISYPATDLTIDGVSASNAAPASLTVNTANIALTGANTYSGGTVVNDGSVTAESANLPANGTIALNNSTLNFLQPVDASFGGVISGSGTVLKQGAGVLTITGANTYAGGTLISGGTLVASSASLPANRSVSVSNGGILRFDQTSAGTFGGVIIDGGQVEKTGTSALTLSNATLSPVNLRAGSLFFTGIGATSIHPGALLGGNGTVGGNLANAGNLSPGLSPGIINVTGNYSQAATGTLVIEIASALSFDKLVVTGSALLDGTLQLTTLDGFNPVGHSYTFLTAAGGVSGQFSQLTGNAAVTNSAAIEAVVAYSSKAVTFSFVSLPFASFALTPNQVAVAQAAQASPALTSAFNAVPTAGQFPAALNAASPQGYEIWSDLAFARSTTIANRLARDDRTMPGQDNFYIETSRHRGRSRGDLDVGATRFTSTAGLVGGDRIVGSSDNLSVGALVGYSRTSSGLGSAGSHTTVKEKTLGLRAAWKQGPWYSHAAFAYSFDDYKSTRAISLPGTSAVATSDTDGRQWVAGIDVGRRMAYRKAMVSPFAGLIVSGWKADGFTESGAGAFNATVAEQSARSLRSQLGLEGRMDLKLGSLQLQPHFRAAWLHEFGNDARMMRSAFGPIAFEVETRDPQRDSALVNVGLDFVLSPRALIYADYSTEAGSGNTRVLGEWRLGLAMRF